MKTLEKSIKFKAPALASVLMIGLLTSPSFASTSPEDKKNQSESITVDIGEIAASVQAQADEINNEIDQSINKQVELAAQADVEEVAAKAEKTAITGTEVAAEAQTTPAKEKEVVTKVSVEETANQDEEKDLSEVEKSLEAASEAIQSEVKSEEERIDNELEKAVNKASTENIEKEIAKIETEESIKKLSDDIDKELAEDIKVIDATLDKEVSQALSELESNKSEKTVDKNENEHKTRSDEKLLNKIDQYEKVICKQQSSLEKLEAEIEKLKKDTEPHSDIIAAITNMGQSMQNSMTQFAHMLPYTMMQVQRNMSPADSMSNQMYPLMMANMMSMNTMNTMMGAMSMMNMNYNPYSRSPYNAENIYNYSIGGNFNGQLGQNSGLQNPALMPNHMGQQFQNMIGNPYSPLLMGGSANPGYSFGNMTQAQNTQQDLRTNSQASTATSSQEQLKTETIDLEEQSETAEVSTEDMVQG